MNIWSNEPKTKLASFLLPVGSGSSQHHSYITNQNKTTWKIIGLFHHIFVNSHENKTKVYGNWCV